MTLRDESNEQTIRNKTHNAQRALTADSKKKERKNTQTNRPTMRTVSEALHITSKIDLTN